VDDSAPAQVADVGDEKSVPFGAIVVTPVVLVTIVVARHTIAEQRSKYKSGVATARHHAVARAVTQTRAKTDEGARLESEAGQRLQAIPTRLNIHAISGLTLANYHAVCVRKPQCSSRLGASRITVLSQSSRSLSACCRVRFSPRPAAFPPTISSSMAWNRSLGPIKFRGVMGPSRQVPLISSLLGPPMQRR
jgi:hypothetical protein